MLRKVAIVFIGCSIMLSSFFINTENLWSTCYAIRSFIYWGWQGDYLCGTYADGIPNPNNQCAAIHTQLACTKVKGLSPVQGRNAVKNATKTISYEVFKGCTFNGTYVQPCAEPSDNYAQCIAGSSIGFATGILYYPVLDEENGAQCLVPNEL